MNPTTMMTGLFCTSQVLTLLHPPIGADVKPFLSGDRHWDGETRLSQPTHCGKNF
jgi:hypothetical protein